MLIKRECKTHTSLTVLISELFSGFISHMIHMTSYGLNIELFYLKTLISDSISNILHFIGIL